MHCLWHYAGEILKDFGTARIADQLSPYHESQFSAFSTEVLIRKNRDTIAVVLPVLPDIAERKVPKHGSRANPTIDPRHDSELMHIML